jgi:hypothetical protein
MGLLVVKGDKCVHSRVSSPEQRFRPVAAWRNRLDKHLTLSFRGELRVAEIRLLTHPIANVARVMCRCIAFFSSRAASRLHVLCSTADRNTDCTL